MTLRARTMPFVKRYVEPRFVSRKELEAKVDDELEAVQINTLASLIRQLGSVMSYADEILGEFAETCTSFNMRLVSLRSRANRLREEVLPELDATEEGRFIVLVCVNSTSFSYVICFCALVII